MSSDEGWRSTKSHLAPLDDEPGSDDDGASMRSVAISVVTARELNDDSDDSSDDSSEDSEDSESAWRQSPAPSRGVPTFPDPTLRVSIGSTQGSDGTPLGSTPQSVSPQSVQSRLAMPGHGAPSEEGEQQSVAERREKPRVEISSSDEEDEDSDEAWRRDGGKEQS